MTVKFIAEVSSNHHQDIIRCFEFIDKAAEIGCDAIKFQHIINDEVYAPGQYKYGNYKIDDVRNLRKIGQLSIDQFKELVNYGKKINIEVFATSFGLKSLTQILDCGVNIIKIASGDLLYRDLIDEVIRTKKEIILSTAMISSDNLGEVIDYINKTKNIGNIAMLHCVGQYPHDIDESQIGALKFIRDNFLGVYGYSDHTLGTESAVAAAALGASIFEKHFTLSRNLGGLDSKHSLEPEQMKNYVNVLRKINESLKSDKREFTNQEILTSKRALRGCYYRVDLKKGKKLSPSDIIGLRPNQGISIKDKSIIASMIVKKNVKALSPIQMEDLSQID